MPLTEEQIREIRQVVADELQPIFGVDRLIFEKNIQIFDGRNIQLGRTIGTKVATATDQKIGFYGVTPIIQASAIGNAAGTDAAIINAIRDVLKDIGITA